MLTPGIKAFYNEIDPYCCAWLSNLMDAGHITPGKIDDRPIQELTAADVAGYDRAHFFAGIAGWDYALNLANWGSRFVWTGSCPCQPFSVAGKGKAQSDDRHLWPIWFKLIAQIKPPVVFGEQVAGAIAHGWLDDAFDDLEGQGYETAACVLPACSVGAPHKRDRLWFVAQSPRQLHDGSRETGTGRGHEHTNSGEAVADAWSSGLQGQGQHEQSSDTKESGSREAAEPRNGCPSDFWGIEPPLGRVANGIPARAHKLRAYGNAIVPQLAAEFIKAYMEI